MDLKDISEFCTTNVRFELCLKHKEKNEIKQLARKAEATDLGLFLVSHLSNSVLAFCEFQCITGGLLTLFSHSGCSHVLFFFSCVISFPELLINMVCSLLHSLFPVLPFQSSRTLSF